MIHPIPGFPNYGASEDGRIWSRHKGPWVERRTIDNGFGYLKVNLWVRGRSYTRTMHVLIALTFLGPRPTKLTVNHKDGVKHNNALGNLEYVTHSENARHAYATGLKISLRGPEHPNWITDRSLLANPGPQHTCRIPHHLTHRHRPGMTNEHAKLTDDLVREMRALHASVVISYSALGRRYGVSKHTALRIVKRQKWAHVV